MKDCSGKKAKSFPFYTQLPSFQQSYFIWGIMPKLSVKLKRPSLNVYSITAILPFSLNMLHIPKFMQQVIMSK